MKLDLCKIFGVKEKQHFWLKTDCEFSPHTTIKEYYIKNNKIYSVDEMVDSVMVIMTSVMAMDVYYEEPKEKVVKTSIPEISDEEIEKSIKEMNKLGGKE